MFSPRTRPLALDAERLLGLRLSLNTPVVATPELPAGPARAALVSHREAGVRRVTVALRSLRNGSTVLYDLEGEPLEGTLDFTVAVDAALSFAESMGFLFDDDAITEGGPEAAIARWRELVVPPSPGATPPRAGDAAAASEAELLLEEIAEELDDVLAGAGIPEPAGAGPAPDTRVARAPAGAGPQGVSRRPARVPGATLTKFRGGVEPPAGGAAAPPAAAAAASAPAAPAAADEARPAALGRMRLVRRAEPAASALLRLLASF